MALDEKDIIGNDIPRYAIVAGGVVATIVFSNLLITKLHEMPKVKNNMNYALLISGFAVITMGVLGSQYFKYQEKNGKTKTNG